MKFGLMIIGDEILNGAYTDAHFAFVKNALLQRGLRLAWVEYVADELDEIAMRLKRSIDEQIPILVTGGIGSTPDDHTRQAAAKAFGVNMALHPEAVELINTVVAQRVGERDITSSTHSQRLEMARFPVGAQIIPNPYNQVAGFSVGEHYFFPGFPVMAHPMMEWVLGNYYSEHFFKERNIQYSALLMGLQESQITPIMVAVEQTYSGVRTFSLPKIIPGQLCIELGVKANAQACDLLESAWQEMRQKVLELGGTLDDTLTGPS